ncbi:MAG: hypothetical protein GVY18_08195 [Bacteroidetes bacterium]|jgi:transaldolase|nr:hypothetical protein [Bacteroidota bacterium]
MENVEHAGKQVSSDPIVQEVREARMAHARKCGFDLPTIVRDLKKHEQRGGRTVVTFPPKLLEEGTG